MSFIWPLMLLTLLLVPALALMYRLTQRRAANDAARLGTLLRLRDSGGKQVGRKRHIPAVVMLLGLSLLMFALARPQMVLPVPRIEGTVILAFDVSASMGADDIEPSRMEATKLAAKSFVEGQPENVRIGVVSFSDGGLVVQEPSYDRVEIVAAINRLAPQSGTSLGHGIMAALNASLATEDGETGPDGETEAADRRQVVPSGAFAPAIIVLLSDGENMSDPDPMEAAQVAIEQGVRIYTVGIGSTEGTTLTIDGFNIVTRLDEAMLQDIASISEGRYVNATSVEELEEVYDSIDPQFVVRREKFEVTPIFSGLSLVTLMIGGAVSLVWFGRVP